MITTYLYNKICKKTNKFRGIDIFKSIYYSQKFKLNKNVNLLIFPYSNVKVSSHATVSITKGSFKINASWTSWRKRRNISELILNEGSKLIIEDDFALYQGASIYVGKNATLHIQGNSFLNTNTVLNCFQYIEIGKGTVISDDVRIQDSDNHIVIESGVEKRVSKPIIIGDKVWIGKNVLILKGVTISDGAIIAAGSVVVRDIPAKCLAAGNPARVIKQNVQWK